MLSLLAGGPLLAQQSGDTLLVPDSAELYATFFQFHSDFSRWTDQRKAASPVLAAQALDDGAARQFKIDSGDLGKLTGVTQSVMAELQKVDRDHSNYLNGRARYEQHPDPAVLQQFAQRRQQAVIDGVDKLQKLLSASSWAGLHDYINNTHRPRYRNAPGPKR